MTTLRMLASALQLDAKEGEATPRRYSPASARSGSRRPKRTATPAATDQAEAERAEAELIAAYLPEQISDAELETIVDEAIAATGAASPQDMGRVMGAVMPKVKGSADGNRVSAAVRERLGS